MAIGIFKSLIFGDVDSADYGIYITGEAVYNAPQRAVEMVTVPGRNGAIALDQGRWENIEVSYPAGCFGGDQSDFASKISEFRNAIVSQIGYQRLTDEYNPNEYRMAVYAEGLDVKPKSKGRAGEFTITFDCKPQRYLTSGETEIDIDVSTPAGITNPTLYDARPLLKVEGHGVVYLKNSGIVIGNAPLGQIRMVNSRTLSTLGDSNYGMGEFIYNNAYLNTNDEILCNGEYVSIDIAITTPSPNISGVAITSTSNVKYANINKSSQNQIRLTVAVDDISFYKGTISAKSATVNFSFTINSNAYTNTLTITTDYSGSEGLSFYYTLANTYGGTYFVTQVLPDIYGISSKMSSDYTAHIDLDSGQAYIDALLPISLNRTVIIPTDLPVLEPGWSGISFGPNSAITKLKIIPRWWKL